MDKSINMNDIAPRNDSYTLHKIRSNKVKTLNKLKSPKINFLCQVDPLVSLMIVPDSTAEIIGGLDKQIMEIKEVRIAMIPRNLMFDFEYF